MGYVLGADSQRNNLVLVSFESGSKRLRTQLVLLDSIFCSTKETGGRQHESESSRQLGNWEHETRGTCWLQNTTSFDFKIQLSQQVVWGQKTKQVGQVQILYTDKRAATGFFYILRSWAYVDNYAIVLSFLPLLSTPLESIVHVKFHHQLTFFMYLLVAPFPFPSTFLNIALSKTFVKECSELSLHFVVDFPWLYAVEEHRYYVGVVDFEFYFFRWLLMTRVKFLNVICAFNILTSRSLSLPPDLSLTDPR